MNPDSYPADPLIVFVNSLSAAGSMAPLVAYMLFALIVSHICSVLESVLLSTPLSYINGLEQQRHPNAAMLKKMKTEIDRPISSILVVNTIANTVGASLVGSEAARLFDSTGVGIVSGIFTLLVLLFSEIIPKTLGSTYWRNLAVPAAKCIRIFIFLTFPLVVLIERLTRIISRR